MIVNGPIYQGSSQGSNSSSDSRSGDIILWLLVGPFFFALGCLALAMLTVGVAHVLVYAIGVPTGLLGAWADLVTITISGEISASLIDSLLFGAGAGLILGLVQARHRWLKHHEQWTIEALVSPETLTAIRYGMACVLLNVVVSVLAAFIVTAIGVNLPWPAALGGHGGMILLRDAVMLGGGAGGGWDPESFLTSLIFLLLFVSIAVVAAVALSWAAAGWVLVVSAGSPGLAAVKAAATGGAVYGGSLAATGAMMQLALTSKLPKHVDDQPGTKWFLPAVLNGIAVGAANGVVFVTIVVAGAALFGLTVATG